MLITQKTYLRKPSPIRTKYVLSMFDDLNDALNYLLKSRLGKQDRQYIQSIQYEISVLRKSVENNLLVRYNKRDCQK